MAGKYTFVNIALSDEDIALLDYLVGDDSKILDLQLDRSKSIRRLIRQEINRRLPVLTGKGDEIGTALKMKAEAKKGA